MSLREFERRVARLEAEQGPRDARLPSVILQQIEDVDGTRRPADDEVEAAFSEAVRAGRARDRADCGLVHIRIVEPRRGKPGQVEPRRPSRSVRPALQDDDDPDPEIVRAIECKVDVARAAAAEPERSREIPRHGRTSIFAPERAPELFLGQFLPPRGRWQP